MITLEWAPPKMYSTFSIPWLISSINTSAAMLYFSGQLSMNFLSVCLNMLSRCSTCVDHLQEPADLGYCFSGSCCNTAT